MKNFLTNNNNSHEFFVTNFVNNNINNCSKKFRIIKYNNIKIKIKNSINKNVKLYAILNLKTKINLINIVFIKKFKLISFNIFNYEIIILKHN